MVAPPWYPVPPNGYGGIELVVHLLVQELKRDGHRVSLFASKGSSYGTNEFAEEAWREDLGFPHGYYRELTFIARVYKKISKLKSLDLIHDHMLIGLLAASFIKDVPALHTVHGSISEIERTLYHEFSEDIKFAAISDFQKKQAPELPWAGTAYNAVDIKNLHRAHAPANPPYLLLLARITPEKGQHIAISVAKSLNMRLVLAGKVDSGTGGKYFAEQINPHIDGDKVVYIPQVAGEQKASLLSGATVALAPLMWEEPFGLFMAEAMVSGTPVVAFPRGAAPEIILPGTSGFLVADEQEMVDAIKEIGSIDRKACAKYARERFSPKVMAKKYLEIYNDIL